MFGIALENRAFKAKKSFLENVSFLSFFQKFVLAVCRVKKIKEVLLEFFFTKYTSFLFGYTF
jgi:hypothetical protein